MGFYAVQKEGLVERTNANRKDPRNLNKTHYHGNHELYYLMHGHTKYFVGDEIYYLEEGNMIFIPRGVLHLTDSESCDNTERILITFTDDMLDEHTSEYLRKLYDDKLICFSDKALPKIEELLRKMELESKRRLNDHEYLFKLYLRELLIFITRYRMPRGDVRLSESQKIVKSVTDYINENFDKPLREEEIAELFAMSKSHFSRKFKSVTGLGYSEYLTNVRITNSEKLLRESSLPITEISQQCGFNDSNYFASVFKKFKGITPYKYSKLYKK